MNFILKVLRMLFTLYAGTYFILSFFIVIPIYFIVFNFWNKEKAPRIAHGVSQIWAHVTLAMIGVRTKISGKELIDPDETYIFVSNHRSMIDIPLYAVTCKNTFRFLSKAELTKVPLLGYIIKRLYITVIRSDRTDRSRSLDAMKKSIDEHISVFLCPEGTRNKTEKPLLDFHDGAFRVAIKTQRPLAVLTVLNSDRLLSPNHPLQLSPGIIYAEWSKPIETKGMTENDVSLLKEKTKNLMLEILNKNQYS